MKLFMYVTDFIVPLVIFGIVSYGVLMKVNVYDTFIKGAKSGFFTVIKIMPTLIGLMVAVGVLRASGFLDFLSGIIGQFTEYIGFPGELVPLTVVKMFSSSAATGLLLDAFKEYGTDSYIGLVASISMSCTETIFYDSQSHEDQIYSGGRHACDLCRACGQRGAGWYDGGRVRGFLSFIRESGIKTLLGTLRIIGPDE